MKLKAEEPVNHCHMARASKTVNRGFPPSAASPLPAANLMGIEDEEVFHISLLASVRVTQFRGAVVSKPMAGNMTFIFLSGSKAQVLHG
jgi:hypothetical protein